MNRQLQIRAKKCSGFVQRATNFVLLVGLIHASQTFAASGRITDDSNGRPIPGAMVYAAWYGKPSVSLLQIVASFFDPESHIPDRVCFGSAVAVTDANGEYNFDPLVQGSLTTHESIYEIAAEGYFDANRGAPLDLQNPMTKLLATLPWAKPQTSSSNTRALTPIPDNASIDVKLLALNRAQSESCRFPFEPEFQKFHEAIRKELIHTLCKQPKPPTSPRTDVFQYVLRAESRDATQFRHLFVDPYLPTDGTLAVPSNALENACGFERAHISGVLPSADAVSSKVLISLRNADDNKPATDIPVRILWGWRPSSGSASNSLLPRRSIIAKTDKNGWFELPVTEEMLQEQQVRANGYRKGLNYVVIPYATDRVTFDLTNTNLLKHACDIDALFIDYPRLPEPNKEQMLYPGYRCPDDRVDTGSTTVTTNAGRIGNAPAMGSMAHVQQNAGQSGTLRVAPANGPTLQPIPDARFSPAPGIGAPQDNLQLPPAI